MATEASVAIRSGVVLVAIVVAKAVVVVIGAAGVVAGVLVVVDTAVPSCTVCRVAEVAIGVTSVLASPSRVRAVIAVIVEPPVTVGGVVSVVLF